ncbi:MAG: ribosome small subunit-dependent GTPase A [Bacteroidetes bacterium]|nr:ribosome small subunit-dependent GTPase A [Bacteroidota bacterium]
MEGLVFKSTGSWYKVKAKNGQNYQCRIRGKLKLSGAKTTNPVAVGDRVNFEPEMHGDDFWGIITKIHQRTNYIIRKSVHKRGHGHILAANIDQAMLMVTRTYPRTSQGFIDRFLVNTESFRIPAILVFNKIDLLDEDSLHIQRQLANVYQSIGYECLFISALKNKGVDNFHRHLQKKVTLLAGHSGVGKSSLINLLSPEIGQKVKEISDFSLKGKHATTFAEMFELEANTYIIDTPGIKELGMIDMEDWEISHYFPEMRQYLGECKFNNCLHVNEPGCVVLNALASGVIYESRYMSYLSMLEDEDNRR